MWRRAFGEVLSGLALEENGVRFEAAVWTQKDRLFLRSTALNRARSGPYVNCKRYGSLFLHWWLGVQAAVMGARK